MSALPSPPEAGLSFMESQDGFCTCTDNLEQHGLQHEMVSVSSNAASMPGTCANLREGDLVSTLDLIYAMLLCSGNDAAVALAEHFGGDVHGFVNMMDAESRSLSLAHSTWQNPTGLDENANVSCALDVAIVLLKCMEYSVFRTVFATKKHVCMVQNELDGCLRTLVWENSNRLLGREDFASGGKTGMTRTAGTCFACVGNIQGDEYILVLLRSRSIRDRWLDASRLLRHCRNVCSCGPSVVQGF